MKNLFLLSLLFVSLFSSAQTIKQKQVDGLGDSIRTLRTSSPYKISLKNVDSIYAFGNSFTAGYGVGSGEGYIDIFKNRYGLSIINLSLSASGVWYAASQANLFVDANVSVMETIMNGFNDLRRSATAATYRKIAGCTRSVIAANLVNVISAANTVTKSGTWGTFRGTDFGGRITSVNSVYSNTSGSYLEYTASGSDFIIGLFSQHAVGFTGGEVDVTVDGVLYTHKILNESDGVTDGVYNNELCPGVIFVKGLTTGAHTIRLTNTTNNYVYVDYFATAKTPENCQPVIVSLIPKMDATGYSTSPNNGSNSVFESGDDVIIGVVKEFSGWPVTYVSVNNFYELPNGLSSADHIHPNVLGYKEIADAFSSAINIDPAVITTPSLTNQQLAYGDGSNLMTSSPNLKRVGDDININGANPVIKITDANGNNGTFYSNYLDFLQLAVNRNPNTGTFINSGKSAAQLSIEGANGGSAFHFYTAAANNTTPSERVYINSTGRTFFGGSTSATALVHLGAGTATANTAPLKLTAGTNLTTPEDGAIEYNGTHFYGTVGSTRYQLDQQSTGGGGTTTNALSIAAELHSGGATSFDGSAAISLAIQAGSVTNSMLAGSIALSKLSITGTPDGTKFLRDDGSWQTISGGGITGLSAIGSTPNNNGATITGTTLNLEPADGTHGGVVSNGTQTLSGNKTIVGESTTTGYAFNVLNSGSGNLFKVSNNISNGIVGIGITPRAGYGINQLYGIYIGDNSTSGEINQPYQTAPTTPATGRGITYWKSDGKLYGKNDAGTEYDLTATGGGGSMVYPGAGIPVSTGSAWGTSLTASTIGTSVLTLTNPSAVTFPRYNADNTVTARTAAQLKTDLSIDNVENTALSTWAGSTNISTLGTIGTGTWHGAVISPQYGGTGVNNGVSSITLGGPLVTSGSSTITLTSTATTNVTLPTTGTVSTLAGTETLTNKTITSATNNVEGTLVNVRFLTSGTTYTPTSGTTKALIVMIGAGGGGGGVTGAATSVGAAGGGGAGGYCVKFITGVTGTYTYAIGTAGTAGANTGGTGGNGGNTTFANGATTYTAFGGSGGVGQTAGTAAAFILGGAGAVVSTNGDINAGGSPGLMAYRVSGTLGYSGTGGDTEYGGAGIGLTSAAAGNAATGFGAGGGGALSTANTARAGGAGAPGLIIIYEYK